MALAVGVLLDGEAYGIAVAGPIHRMRQNLREHVAALKAVLSSIAELSRERAVAGRIG
jgi:hypothetical protein